MNNYIFNSITLAISLLLGLIPVAVADSNFVREYQPSTSQKKTYQRKTTSIGGSRTYCQNPLNDKTLTLIVPDEEIVHQTANFRPSFFFHSEGKSNIPLIFTLIDPDKTEPLVEKNIAVNNSGYHEIELPEEIELRRLKVYSWYIAIPCSNNPKTFREVLKASVKYVPLPPHLNQKIERQSSQSKKAEIYAREGRWYDAVESIDLTNFSIQSFKN